MAVRQLTQDELQQLARELRDASPPLDPHAQRIALAVFRLLAEGEPAYADRIAEAADVSPETVARALGDWPAVYRNDEGAVIGFWGLAQQEFPPHRFEVDGRQLWGWCSWDTLFLPVVLDREARIESVCATTGEPVTALVGPDGVHELSPASAVISFLRPSRGFDDDVIRSFCHHVLYFSSPQAGQTWIGDRDDAFLLTLEQGFELGRLVFGQKLAAALADDLEAA